MRHQRAAGCAAHGFRNKGGNAVRSFHFDHSFQIISAFHAASSLLLAKRTTIAVSRGNMRKIKQQGGVFFSPLISGHRKGANGIAMKAFPAGNHPILAAFPIPLQVILSGHFQRCLSSFRAAGHQIKTVQASRRQLRHSIRQLPNRIGSPAG